MVIKEIIIIILTIIIAIRYLISYIRDLNDTIDLLASMNDDEKRYLINGVEDGCFCLDSVGNMTYKALLKFYKERN